MNLIQFSISDDQFLKLQEWLNAIRSKIADENGYVNAGAIGGEITYQLTPTSLGDFISVRHNITGEILSLTDYDTL